MVLRAYRFHRSMYDEQQCRIAFRVDLNGLLPWPNSSFVSRMTWKEALVRREHTFSPNLFPQKANFAHP